MTMSALVLQHFQQPKFIGEIQDSPNVIRIESNSPNTGRHVIVYVLIDNHHVADVRCRVRGCPYTIATFSYVAEYC